jgi:hypothetical protein
MKARLSEPMSRQWSRTWRLFINEFVLRRCRRARALSAGFNLFQSCITAQIAAIFDLNNNQKNVFEFFLFVFHLFFSPFRFNE